MFHRHKRWVSMTGEVLDRQVLPGPRAPHPKLVTVELHQEDSAPIRAEVRLVPGDRHHWDDDLYYPQVGDVAGFMYDPGSHEARFDMTDPRNSMAAHLAAGEAWAAATDDDDDEPTQAGSGPPWLVVATCPSCRRPVDQRQVAMERQPHCPACAQVLPAYPVVTSQRTGLCRSGLAKPGWAFPHSSLGPKLLFERGGQQQLWTHPASPMTAWVQSCRLAWGRNWADPAIHLRGRPPIASRPGRAGEPRWATPVMSPVTGPGRRVPNPR